MRESTGDNFVNILRAAFSYENDIQSFSVFNDFNEGNCT